jgi:MFS family permease
VFISNADGTLVLATLGTISSEFNDLQNGVWLTSGFGLATCAVQPLVSERLLLNLSLHDFFLTNATQYGKLSDIFGRKVMLQVSYLIFAIGSAISYVFNPLDI